MTSEELNKYVNMGDIEKDEEITTERAIAEVYRWIRVVEYESYEYENLTPKVLDMVIQSLSAEKTAEWILKDGIYGVAYCSKCDYELHTNDTNYCPNCGAKMKESGEE